MNFTVNFGYKRNRPLFTSLELEVPEGRIEDRYYSLKNCLLTKKKFEGSRLR